MTTCPLCEAAARTPGDDWMVLADLARCVVRLGENQGLPGWCVLVLKDHREHLHELDGRDQAAIFEDVARVGRAARALSAHVGSTTSAWGTLSRTSTGT